ncbi:hypothetical protein TL16_g06740 [Triparma laevis f. inornata]|uniref:H15 domain-containing protein n=1 Tax=Triparma laevis f. inornata TaxID=1714386 RepID=A0A9W7AUJ2_9STRA|nr:hypothetical protein TL16_g06740 [Triparma laevis f. inornata]
MSEVIMDVEMADAVPELAQAPLPKAKLDDLALLVADSDDVIRSASEILTAYSTTHRLWQILRIEDKSINRKWGTYAGLSRIALGGKGFKCMKSKKDPTLKWLLIDTIDPVGEHNLTVSPVEFLDIQNEYEASVKSSKKRKKKDDSAAIDVVVKKRTYLEACIVVLREKGVVSRPSLASFVSVLQGAENDKKLSSNIKTALEKGIRENVIVKVSASFKLNPAWVKSERDKAKKAKIAKEAPVKFPIEDRLLPAYDKKHRTKDKDKKLPLPVGAPIGDMDKPWMNDCIAIHALFSDEAFVGRVGFSYDLLNRALEMGPKFPAFFTTLMVKSLKLLAGDAGGDEGGDEKEKKVDRRYDIFEDFVDLICPLTWPKCVVLFFEQQGLYSEKRIARERQENCLQGQQEDFDLFSKESEKIIGKLKKDEPGALSPLERAQLLRMLADELSAKYMLSVYEERSQAAEEAAKKTRKAEAEVKKIAKDNEQMKAEWVREEEEEAAKTTPKKRKKRDGGEREQLISTMEKAEKSSTLAVEEAEEDYEDLISTEVNRHPSLGADKNGSEYFHFPSLPGKLFVKSKSGKKWSVFSKMSEYDAIVAALDERGINELALKGKLRGRAYMTDDVLDEKKQLEIERLNKRIERLQEDQKRMEEHVLKQGRRSTRVVEEGSKTTGPSELEVLISKRDGVGSDVDLYLDPEVAQLKETGVLVSLAEDLELQGPIDVYQKIPKYPKHGVGSAPGDHKVLPFHEATNPATFLAREILAFEASVTAFQPLSDRTRSSKFRDDLKAIADDEYVTIKEKLKVSLRPSEARM